MVCVIFGGQVFSQVVNLSTEQGSAEFKTLLYVILAMPLLYYCIVVCIMWQYSVIYCTGNITEM